MATVRSVGGVAQCFQPVRRVVAAKLARTLNSRVIATQPAPTTQAGSTVPPPRSRDLFNGRYERTHRFTFGTAPIADKHTDISYPVLLRRAGYRTGFVGKFGVGVEPGGTQRMFDYFVPLDRNPYFKKQPDGSERHLTDIETDKAIAFLDTIKPGEPFCLSVSFNAPHAE